jgi:hypothetical protein
VFVGNSPQGAEMIDEELEQNSSATNAIGTQQLGELVARALRQAHDIAPIQELEAVEVDEQGGDDEAQDDKADAEEANTTPDDSNGSGASVWDSSLSAMQRLAQHLANEASLLEQLTSDSPSARVSGKDARRNPAFEARAAWLKQELGAVPQLRSQVADLSTQVRELSSDIGNKSKALVEAARKQSILEGKIASLQTANEEAAQRVIDAQAEMETQTKRWEHSLLSMQEDINSLEDEKAQLQERFAAGLEDGALLANSGAIGGGAAAAGHRLGMSLIADEMVQSLNDAIRFLQRENAALRRTTSTSIMAQLPELKARAKNAGVASAAVQLVSNASHIASVRQRAMLLQASPVVVTVSSARAAQPSVALKLPTPLMQRSADVTVLQRELQQARTALSTAVPQIAALSSKAPAQLQTQPIGRVCLPVAKHHTHTNERLQQLRALVVGTGATSPVLVHAVSLDHQHFSQIQSVFVK